MRIKKVVTIMRIDAYNKVNQVYQTNVKTQTTKKEKMSKSDKVEISQFGRDLQVAKQAVENMPDIREEKVEVIKTAITSRTYEVSMEEVADKLVNHFFNTVI